MLVFLGLDEQDSAKGAVIDVLGDLIRKKYRITIDILSDFVEEMTGITRALTTGGFLIEIRNAVPGVIGATN